MKRFLRILCGMGVVSIIPGVVAAAGTYYNGNLYQNPQQRYSRSGGGYYNSYGYGSNRGYNARNNVESQLGTQKQTQKKKVEKQTTRKNGFILDAGLSHEMATWSFDMNQAGSKLHYDNLMWNVFDVNGAYYFDGGTPMQVKLGFKYGKQYDESPMVDDDISQGGSVSQEYVDSSDNLLGYRTGHALSVGTSDGGTQMGYNFSFGLTDFFKLGRAKMTPSIGYRYFKHELSTKKSYGANVDVFYSDSVPNCWSVGSVPGEVQCFPFVAFRTNYAPIEIASGNPEVLFMSIPAGANQIDLGETYYYEQSGTTHKYETEWAGPYLALDIEYQINNDNLVYGGIEIGLPTYKSTGDQPYRPDWQHPTSVEDEGGFGDAYHFGMNANWMTAITDSVSLTLGLTYDYYKVSNATAKTYVNIGYYQDILDDLDEVLAGTTIDAYPGLRDYYEGEYTNMEKLINELSAVGGVLEDKKEINSIYKSMGIRVGVSVKF